jgi:toxin-antitoxin system PIN domain toxin
VIVIDANILLYAYDADSDKHAKARAWVEEVFSGASPVGLPWQTVSAFMRIVTNPRLTGKRFTPAEVVEIVDEWVNQPNVRLLGPGDDHWNFLRQMMVDGQARGPLVTDAQLAALTIEYGGVLHTTDRDFSRFPGLRWKNPIA